LPHRPSAVEIVLSWRGSPEPYLPASVAPLTVQVMGLELSLAPVPAR